jgi:hypothetical protein
MTPRWRPWAWLLAAACGAGTAHAQAPAQPANSADAAGKSRQVVLVCEAAYLPARSVWVRRVAIDFDEERVRAVHIDGVPVYTFSVNGTVIATALDNERIRIDIAAQHWVSDFRGLATSQGRCEQARSTRPEDAAPPPPN